MYCVVTDFSTLALAFALLCVYYDKSGYGIVLWYV